MMEQTHVPTSRQPIAACEALASSLRTLRRLSEPHAQFWLEGTFSDKSASTTGMVLLTHLPAIFLSPIETRRAHG